MRGGKAELLEGAPEPERIVVIEFPDADTARRWYHSDEYQQALKIRQANSTGRLILVEGASLKPLADWFAVGGFETGAGGSGNRLG